MKLQDLFESDAKKYVDKDGKTVHRLPGKDKPKKEEPVTTKATKCGPVTKGDPFRCPWTPSELIKNANYDKRIRPRAKGERADPDIVGNLFRFAHEHKGELYYYGEDGKRDPNPMAQISVVGKTKLQHPMWETWVDAQTLELHFENGSIIPATRLGPTHVIVQDYRFKAYMPSGTAKFWSIIRDHNNR